MAVKIKTNWDDLNVISEGVRIYKSASAFTSSSLPAVYATIAYGVDEFEDLDVVENGVYFYMLSSFLADQEVFSECFRVAADVTLWVDLATLLATLSASSAYSGLTPTATQTNMVTMSGNAKWAGGVLAPNGKIYCVPHSSNAVLIIDPKTNTGVLDSSLVVGSVLNGWMGGVLAPNGKIYCVPHSSNAVLIIDPKTNTATASNFGLDLTGNAKWSGAVLASDGKIYCCPYDANAVLVIDPEVGTAVLKTFGLTISGSAKWSSFVLAPNNKIYAIPSSSNNFLIIDTETNTANYSNMGLSLSGSLKWTSGALCRDGQIIAMPNFSNTVLKVNTETNTATTMAISGANTNFRFAGTVTGCDGRVYGVPRNNLLVGMYRLDINSAFQNQLGASWPGNAAYFGAILAPNGNIYFVPHNANTVGIVTKHIDVQAFDLPTCLTPQLNKI